MDSNMSTAAFVHRYGKERKVLDRYALPGTRGRGAPAALLPLPTAVPMSFRPGGYVSRGPSRGFRKAASVADR